MSNSNNSISKELEFSVANCEDVSELIEFIVCEFFTRFPLTEILRLQVEVEVRPWLGQYVAHIVSKNCTVLVRDQAHNNRIAAAAINDIVNQDRSEEDISLVSFNNPEQWPAWGRICQLLDILHTDVQFDRYPILSLDLMTVGRDYAGQGLSKECANATIRQAQLRNIAMVKVEAFNNFMAKGLSTIGFELVKTVNYNFYANNNGEKPYATDSVHNKAQLFVFDTSKSKFRNGCYV